MVGHHHEEDDGEDPEVRLARLEQGIATLTELVTQLLVMKGKEAHLVETEHEECKAGPESPKGEMLGNLGYENFSSSSNIPFKVEAKFEITMFDGQTNVEFLDGWLKQLEVYFGLYQVQETQRISFPRLKMIGHDLLWWESYVDALRIGNKPIVTKREAFKALLKSQFYPIGYEEEQLMKRQYLWQEQGQGVQEYTFEFRRQAIQLGISLEEPGVVMKYLGGLFSHIRRQLQLHGVKSIDEASKKALYIELDSKKGEHHMGQEETSKRRDKKMTATTEKWKDLNRHCKHCDVDGHMEEKCWKLHPELPPKWLKSKGKAKGSTETKEEAVESSVTRTESEPVKPAGPLTGSVRNRPVLYGTGRFCTEPDGSFKELAGSVQNRFFCLNRPVP
jgi:hypothetical protein